MPSKSSSFAKVGGASHPLSTSARVHPSYLPYLAQSSSRGKGMKWIPPVAAVGAAAAVGYGVATYREAQVEKQIAATKAAEQAETDRRRRTAALMDAYGDRSSLVELEKAMHVYEAQNGTA